MSNYIRFDWAMKRLLRNKANFAVLEGFLTTRNCLKAKAIRKRNLTSITGWICWPRTPKGLCC